MKASLLALLCVIACSAPADSRSVADSTALLSAPSASSSSTSLNTSEPDAVERGCSYFRPDLIGESRLEDDGWSVSHPVMTAVASGELRRVSDLLQNGAGAMEVDARDGLSPLEVAARTGCVEMLELLVENGAPLDPSGVWAPLIGAVRSLNPGAVEFFLDSGVDPNQVATDHPEANGTTALHAAAALGEPDLIRILIAGGADPATENNMGETPLFAAAEVGQQGSMAILLQHGATPDADTLTVAVLNRDLETVSLLLAAGVDPEAPNDSGVSPIELAEAEGFSEIVDYIKEAEEQ